jgi:general secretion pathway protein D
VKRYLALVCLLSWGALLQAEPAVTNSVPAATNKVDRTELMLRRLREAMTNPPSRGSEAQPATAPVTAAPTLAAPTTAPAITNAPSPAATIARPALAAPVIPPALTNLPTLGATLPVRTNRTVPTRGPTIAAPPPPANLPGVPGAGVNAPSAAAPPRPAVTNVVNVAADFDPNETIPAGTIQLQGMEPDQFFDIYSQVSGRTVIRPYTLQGLQKITLKAATDWTRQEAVFAMDAVMAQNGVAMIPIGDKFVKAVPMQFAPTEGAEPSTVAPTDYAEAETFITEVVTLKYMKPTDLQQLLSTFTKSPQGITAFDATQTVVIRDYASNVKRMIEVIRSVDVAPREPDYTLEAIPIKYGKVIDLYNTMQSLVSGGGAAGGTTGTTGTQTTQGMQGRFGGSRFGGGGYGGYGGMGGSYGGYGGSYGGYGGGYGRSYGAYPYDESVTRLTPQQVATPAPTTPTTGARGSVGGAQASFQNRLNQIVRRAASGTGADEVQVLEDARIVPDERSNKLLVFANKRDMSMITNIISKVDVLLAQVLIEAIIMEVQLGDTYKLGVSWAQQPKSFGNGSAGAGVINNGQNFLSSLTNFPSGSPSGFTYFGTIADDWNVAINALASNSSINIVSRPRIQTSHAIPGSFFVGQTVPYVTGYNNYGGYYGVGGVATSSIIQQANVGFSLFVTPFITPDGLVVMEIAQDFSTLGANVIIDNNPIPIINSRNAESTLTVRNGDTIMMGGFITENRSKDNSGVPFLKDIPGLGVLFRSRNDNNNRSELIVLMRARVLRSPEEAAIMAAQEKSDLPGVRQAETELKDANEKRNNASKAAY